MRNIEHTTTSSQAGLENAGKGLSHKIKEDNGSEKPNPRYEAYHNNIEELKKAYQEYDEHTSPCKLEEINAMPLSKAQRDGLKELYGRSRPFIEELWQEVAYVDREYKVCPFCGQQPVHDLDHYIPRAEMPEYSVHLLNLIPTCHECNMDKGDGWINDEGQRIFFNAYFDEMADVSRFLTYTLTIVNDTELPQVVLTLNSEAISAGGETGRLVSSTYNNIENVREQWQSKASSVLKNEIRQVTKTVNVSKRRGTFVDGADAWGFEQEMIDESIADALPHEFIEKSLLSYLKTSTEFEKWILKFLNSL